MEFQVHKKDLQKTRLVDSGVLESNSPLKEGEVLLAVDKFSFTANNITYGVTGDQLGYWQFFPASDNDANEWGLIPVWGFAEVIASSHQTIGVGERLFGYFPPASFVKLKPSDVHKDRLIDSAAHRSHLPPGYNMYRRVLGEPGYDQNNDDLRALLFPLHITSFCLFDVLDEQQWYGANQAIVVSASSKTSTGLAYGLQQTRQNRSVIGLTSKRNVEFVELTRFYNQVADYDALHSIDLNQPSVIIDMSGNQRTLATLHQGLGNNMLKTINVGLTHWDERDQVDGIIKDRSEFFFAPSHIQQRLKDWGPAGFGEKSMTYIMQAGGACRSWLKMNHVSGLAGLSEQYESVLQGQQAPEQGLIIMV